jgi:hypothetical protein
MVRANPKSGQALLDRRSFHGTAANHQDIVRALDPLEFAVYQKLRKELSPG